MPSQNFALTKNGPKRLEISKEIFSEKRTIRFDGKEIGVIANDYELKRGWGITSKDGTTLTIKKGSAWDASYDVRLNGVPLPDADGDPQYRINNAVRVLAYITVVNVAAGLIASNSREGFMGIDSESGLVVLITGILYGIVALFVWRGSLVALGIAIAGYAIDTLSVLLTFGDLFGLGIAGIILRPLFFYLLIRAINPTRKLRQQQKISPRPRRQLTKVEMSLLLTAVVMVGVIVIGSVLSSPNLKKAVYVAANLPLPSSTPKPSPTPSPTPQLAQIEPLPFRIRTAVYSQAIDRIIATSDDNQLHIYNPETQDDAVIPLSMKPLGLALNSDGTFVAVSHEYKISYVDLVKQKVITVLDTSIDISRMLLSDNGWIYLHGEGRFNNAATQHNAIAAVEIASNREIVNQSPYYGNWMQSWVLSLDNTRLYVLGQHTIDRYDIANMANFDPEKPSAQRSLDWRDNETRIMLAADGDYLFTDCGNVMKLSSDAKDDFKESNRAWGSCFILGSLYAKLDEAHLIGIGGSGDSLVLFPFDLPHSPDQLGEKVSVPLGKLPYATMYRNLFVNAAKTRSYVIIQWQPTGEYELLIGLIKSDIPLPQVTPA